MGTFASNKNGQFSTTNATNILKEKFKIWIEDNNFDTIALTHL